MTVRPGISALLGAIGGAAIASLWSLPFADASVAPPEAGEHAASPASAAPVARPASTAVPSAIAELGVVEARLDDVVDRLRAIETKVDRALAPAERTAAITEPVTVDADTLQEALVEVDRRRLAAMSDEALRQHAFWTMKGDGDYGAASRALQLLVDRATTPAARAAALTDLGMVQRMQGGEQSLAASVRSLRTVVDEHGVDSAAGITAALQIVWSLDAQRDPGAALQYAQAVATSRTATTEQRLDARWAAAIMTQHLGDRNGARMAFEALVRELDGRPGQEKRVADIRRRLEGL